MGARKFMDLYTTEAVSPTIIELAKGDFYPFNRVEAEAS